MSVEMARLAIASVPPQMTIGDYLDILQKYYDVSYNSAIVDDESARSKIFMNYSEQSK